MNTDVDTAASIAHSLAPMLSVPQWGARAVEFYKSAFGTIEGCRI